MPVRELAEQVAAWENDKPIDALTSQERKRVYIALYQSHLPSMDTEGLLEYDEDASSVTLSDHFATREIYMELVRKDDVSGSSSTWDSPSRAPFSCSLPGRTFDPSPRSPTSRGGS